MTRHRHLRIIDDVPLPTPFNQETSIVRHRRTSRGRAASVRVCKCLAVGAIDGTVVLLRDGTALRSDVLDWGAVLLLLSAVSLLAAGETMRSSRASRDESVSNRALSSARGYSFDGRRDGGVGR